MTAGKAEIAIANIRNKEIEILVLFFIICIFILFFSFNYIMKLEIAPCPPLSDQKAFKNWLVAALLTCGHLQEKLISIFSRKLGKMKSLIQENDSYIQTLMNLGPTLLQAKTYMALVNLGKGDVKTISKASNVARSDVYRIMPALEKLGLAEKIIGRTTMYKPTPIRESLSILLQNRKQEYVELEKKTTSLLNSSYHYDLQDLQEENQQFKITSERNLLQKMLKNLMQSAKTSIDMVMPGKALQEKLLSDPFYFRTINKNVKIRVLTQKVEGKISPIKPQALAKNRFIETTYSNKTGQFAMHIIDEKEVTLCLTEKEGGLPCLWSNNHSIVKLAEAYFEKVWVTAEMN